MASTTDGPVRGDRGRRRRAGASTGRRDPALAGARDAEGVSALMRARYRSDRGATQALIEAGPDLDLFEAAAFGDLDRLTALLTGGADVDAVSADGFTPLHLAAFFGKPEAVTLLLAAAPRPTRAGRDG